MLTHDEVEELIEAQAEAAEDALNEDSWGEDEEDHLEQEQFQILMVALLMGLLELQAWREKYPNETVEVPVLFKGLQ